MTASRFAVHSGTVEREGVMAPRAMTLLDLASGSWLQIPESQNPRIPSPEAVADAALEGRGRHWRTCASGFQPAARTCTTLFDLLAG